MPTNGGPRGKFWDLDTQFLIQVKTSFQLYQFFVSVLQLRSRRHLLVLLEHGLLHDRVPEGALAQGAQEEVQERKNRSGGMKKRLKTVIVEKDNEWKDKK